MAFFKEFENRFRTTPFRNRTFQNTHFLQNTSFSDYMVFSGYGNQGRQRANTNTCFN